MLFVRSNHYCYIWREEPATASLQATSLPHGHPVATAPLHVPTRKVDASHPDVMLDFNRCILCARCIRASQEQDGKHVFQFIQRGATSASGVNAGEWRRRNQPERDRQGRRVVSGRLHCQEARGLRGSRGPAHVRSETHRQRKIESRKAVTGR